jgi:hypothetical protein
MEFRRSAGRGAVTRGARVSGKQAAGPVLGYQGITARAT